MERVSYRTIVNKLNKLVQAEKDAMGVYLLADLRSEAERSALKALDEARYQLDQFRNTKVSELHYLFK